MSELESREREESDARARTPAPDDASRALGRLFSEARDASGFSQEEVAGKLYLSPALIRKIDAGDFSDLPKPAYLRGYLRGYARLVGLSGDDVIGRYRAISQPEGETPQPLQDVTDEEVGSVKLTGPVAATGAYGLAAAVAIMLLVWLLSSDEEVPSGAIVSGVATPPAAESMDTGVIRSGEDSGAGASAFQGQAETGTPFTEEAEARAAPGEGASDAQAPSATVITGQRVALEIGAGEDAWRDFEAQEAEPGDPDVADEGRRAVAEDADDPGRAIVDAREGPRISMTRSRDGGARIVTVRTGGPDHLSFTFTGDCWIEVADGAGAVLYEDLHNGGDRVDLFGEAPFRVLVGQAHAVVVLFNDRPVELIPNVVNNTAIVQLDG